MERERTFTVMITGYRGCCRVSACTPYHAKQKFIELYSHINPKNVYVQPPMPAQPSIEKIMKKW